jgi:D-glycero-D-manno-heptose 1,7-bisphosphate phosphatase
MTADVGLRPAVFLDRDGVLNKAFVRDGKPYGPRSLDEFTLLPGVAEACAELHAAGFALVVVTNQPDIARGSQTRELVEQMHAKLRAAVPLDDIVVCPHDDVDDCDCRKPRPGMILDAVRRLRLDPRRSVLIGDRWRDIEAARRAAIRAIHIDCDYDEREATGADATVPDLPAAVAWIRRTMLDYAGGEQ